MSHDLIQKAVTALEWVNDNCPDEMPIVDEALFDLRDELAKPVPQGWYCAHCERGVDPIEVTFNEAHEACGRIITNDEPPAAKPAAVPTGWRTFPDEVPPPDTECLVEVPFRDGTFRAVDTWEMQSECPVPWSSATVETGYGWSNYCDVEPLRWIPIAHLTAARPQGPAPPVDIEAVRGTIFRMKDNHKLRESRCKPDPLISIWANELARAIGDET